MAISVKNLSKNYGNNQAVVDLSFDVATGEIVGFLGPNGAGKTTTMKIITCFMPPSSGTVEIDGYNIFDHSLEIRRKIGYLPEMNPLYTDMNVLDFLEYAGKLQGMKGPDLQGRIRETVDVTGLGNVRHKDINELSKGYRQRVGLAQAMIHDPDVLVLDEPTSGLDPVQIVEIRNLIRRLGIAKTVILSTHILPEVQATCDRYLIINQGRLVADGSLKQLDEATEGGELLYIDIKFPTEDPMHDIFPALLESGVITNAEYVGSNADVHSFALNTSSDDATEALFNLAKVRGWSLLKMERKHKSLEDVFFKVTSQQNSGIIYEPTSTQAQQVNSIASPEQAEETESAKYMPQSDTESSEIKDGPEESAASENEHLAGQESNPPADNDDEKPDGHEKYMPK